MSYEQIIYEVSEGIATITMNRPDSLNAMTALMYEEMRDAFANADEDTLVRVIILTGAGRGFCAGADMNDLKTLSGNSGAGSKQAYKGKDLAKPANVNEFDGYRTFLPRVSKPIIAAINGPAAGMGFVFALFADIRFSSDKAKFTTSFAQRGLIAEHGVSWILPRLVGIANANDLLFSARKVLAEEARSMGLVNRVVSAETLMQETRNYAKHLVETTSPRSLKVMKRQVYNAMTSGLADSLRIADLEMSASMAHDDFKEGVDHFMEKRSPQFELPKN